MKGECCKCVCDDTGGGRGGGVVVVVCIVWGSKLGVTVAVVEQNVTIVSNTCYFPVMDKGASTFL